MKTKLLFATTIGANASAAGDATVALGSAIAMLDKNFVVAGNVATYRGEGDVIAQAGFAFGF